MNNIRLLVGLLLLAAFAVTFTVNPAAAQEEDPLYPPGWTQGTGTHFALPDSPYLPITLDSSVNVTLTLSSVPEIVDLTVHADSSAGSAEFTFTGFEANTLYYRYMDDNINPVTFTTDADGSFTYTQDLSESHHVWFRDRLSTIFLRDDSTGGDCDSIGEWTLSTKTCKMTGPLTNTFFIRDPGITLDGDGHMLTASGDFAVYASGVSGVTVKNMKISSAGFGIFLERGTDLTATNNTISGGTSTGIYMRGDNPGGSLNDYLTVEDNIISANYIGIQASWGDNLIIEDNTISGGYWGMQVYSIAEYSVTGNIITNPSSSGILIEDLSVSPTATIDGNSVSTSSPFGSSGIELNMRNGSNLITITNNTISGGFYAGIRFRKADNWTMTNNTISDISYSGLYLDNNVDSDGSVYHNNFINNPVQIRDDYAPIATINQPRPIGGNYYSSFSTPGQGCDNIDSDSFCDSPFVFFGDRDELPWTTMDGWLAPTDTTPPVITPVIDGTLGSNDWYTSDVNVSWTVVDDESAVSSEVGCDPTAISSDTDGTTLTCTATSDGGTDTVSVTIKRDATAPTASASLSSAANANGWHNSDVTVSYIGGDDGSGIDSCDTPTVLAFEGAGQSASGTCTDLAGNVSDPAEANGINIDKTAPVLNIATPQLYDVQPLGTALDFTAFDALSGLDGFSPTITLTNASGSSTESSGFTPGVGVYNIVVSATDQAGNTTTSEEHLLVIYDPDGGFVTGGGWIDSPIGAYVANPGLSGKANFGFVSKYKKGANEPTGNTEFQFKAGDLNFHSSSYDWLVVAGQDKAKYKGEGTINGAGNYGFMMTATDKGNNGDTFRIKIWDKDDGDVIYDNQMGSGDDLYTGTVIGGGNIKVHNK